MRRVDPGQTVAAGMPVFSIVELNPVKVRVGVPEAEIGKVHQGAAAEVSAPSLDGRRFTGKVAIIGVAAEPASRTYTVKILVPNPGPVLLAGMVAEARIFGPAKVHVLDHPRRGRRARSTGRAQCLRLLRRSASVSTGAGSRLARQLVMKSRSAPA